MTFTDEQQRKLAVAQEILGYRFEDEQLLLSAITHPSATEGKSVKYSYERLEFLGDSILGAIVATIAFDRFHDLDEGGLTRIKVALVSGASLSLRRRRATGLRRRHRVRLFRDGHGAARAAFRAGERVRGRGGRVVLGRRH